MHPPFLLYQYSLVIVLVCSLEVNISLLKQYFRTPKRKILATPLRNLAIASPYLVFHTPPNPALTTHHLEFLYYPYISSNLPYFLQQPLFSPHRSNMHPKLFSPLDPTISTSPSLNPLHFTSIQPTFSVYFTFFTQPYVFQPALSSLPHLIFSNPSYLSFPPHFAFSVIH